MLFDYRASVSDLTLFSDEPAAWLIKHHPNFQHRTNPGPAAVRGHAVEYGLRAHVRFNLPFLHCCSLAERMFCRNADRQVDAGFVSPNWALEYDAIPDYLQGSFEALDSRGLRIKYHTYQQRIEAELEGVRMLGFSDFVFVDDDGVLQGVDLKTTKQCPSAVRPKHVEQMAYYKYATGIDFAVAYVTPKKYAVYSLTNDQYAEGMARLKMRMNAVKQALQIDNWMTLFTLFPPRDLNSFYWDEQSRNYARQIWSI